MKKAQSEQERNLGSKNSDRKKLKKNQELEDEVKEICLEIYTHTQTRDGLEEKQERKHKKSGDQSRGSTMQLMGF